MLFVFSLWIRFVLQMFVDNFQTAKEALSAATAQAAEKAASSVRDFAQKSFRLSMDINLKAPLIIIPQSSTSHDALVMDLGLITVGNSFSLLPAEGFSLPAVVEKMDMKLTQLKLSRYHNTSSVKGRLKGSETETHKYKHVEMCEKHKLKPLKRSEILTETKNSIQIFNSVLFIYHQIPTEVISGVFSCRTSRLNSLIYRDSTFLL